MSAKCQAFRGPFPRPSLVSWMQRLSRVAARPWLLLSLLAAPALLPFYTQGLTRSFDGGLHLLRISLLDWYIRQGVLYPRWAPELLLGHGYPVFGYYAPASYYLVESLHLLGLSIQQAFVAILALMVITAGLGMFLLTADLFGPGARGAALVAAVAYMYSPYLLTNIYIRGAIAEAGAQALLPWVFLCIRRLLNAQTPAHYLLPVALLTAALAVMHTISLLFVPPVLLIYIAVRWWQGGGYWPALGWAGVALLLAMATSAFFWLPLVLERNHLADTAYTIAQTIWLPGSVWTWDNFLDWGWTFAHTFDRPIRLGLVQVLLAGAGFLLAWRRDSEWLFWGSVALIACAFMSAWALPIWLGSEILTVAQFAWRLLSILSLPLALFAGGLLTRLQGRWAQAVGALALIALIIWAQQPRLDWMDVFAPEDVDLSLPVFLQVETEKGAVDGGIGNSSIQEFRPRWAGETLELDAPDQVAPPMTLTVERADAWGMVGTVAVSNTTPLYFNDYYFPGWQVRLNGATLLDPYPSTNLGLLTVDIPPGMHTFERTWQGTPVQRWSAWLSLAGLLALMGIGWRWAERRWALALPLALMMFGLFGALYRPALATVERPAQSISADGLSLLGLRTELHSDGLYLYPYWRVDASPPDRVRIRWQLIDSNGRTHVDMTSQPYFNSYSAGNFPAGSLADDAYRLPLPTGLHAGNYWIALGLGDHVEELIQKPVIVGQVSLPATGYDERKPRQRVHVQAGEQAQLLGFDLEAGRKPLTATHRRPAVAPAGAYLRYRLYWRALGPIDKNYHGFVHLVDVNGQPLVQEDQLPGPFFHPPRLWDPYRLVTDTYLLRLPPDAPSGLYWPAVGLYDFETLERLPLRIDETSDLGYDYRLPPIKLLNPPAAKPAQALDIQLGEMAWLFGMDMSAPNAEARPGDSLVVTLYYRVAQPTTVNYTRFLHLHSDEHGMAAQQDGIPQNGRNPTWAWQADEVVADTVELSIAQGAPPGVYTLYSGFYTRANGARLPLAAQGQPAPDNRATLATITILP